MTDDKSADTSHMLKEEAILPPAEPTPSPPPQPAEDIMSEVLEASAQTPPEDKRDIKPDVQTDQPAPQADIPPPPGKKHRFPPASIALAVLLFLLLTLPLIVFFVSQQQQLAELRGRAAMEKPKSTALPTATPKPETNRQKSQSELRFDVYSDTYVKKGKGRPEPVMMWNINDTTSGFSGVAYFAYDKGLNQSLLFSRFTGVVPPSGNEVYTVWIKKGSAYEKRGFVDFININGQPVGFSNFALPNDVVSKSDQLVISHDSSFKPTTPENILFTAKGEKIK